ncbi:MAG: hypothetical protein AAF399_22825 [Bacteroidota bacterium]
MVRDITHILAKCLIFAIPFVPLNVYLYYSSPFFEKQQDYHATIEGFFDGTEVNTLIIGDSHPGTITNDMLNDHTYNLAFGGDGLKENYLKLKYVLERSNSVKTLFLTADAQMFGARRVQSSNNSFLNKYVFQTGEFDVYGKSASSVAADMIPLFNDSYIEYLNKSIQDNLSGHIAQRDLYQQLRADHSMWAREFNDAQRIEMAEKTGVSDHRGVLNDSIQVEYYQKIFDLCQSHEVEVIGVKYPAMQEYLAGLPTEKQQDLDSLFNTLDFQAMLDYRNFSQDPTLFKNEDHVNDDGAILMIKEMEAATGLNLGRNLAMNEEKMQTLPVVQ